MLHPHKHWVSWCYMKCYKGVTSTILGSTNNIEDINMEEKKIVYDIITSIWNLVKEYFFHHMTEEEIETIWSRAEQEEKRFKQYGESYRLLFSGLWLSFVQYHERKGK